jgi:peroxiredoxin (alkyl hydroperoxide reductase subunit C)
MSVLVGKPAPECAAPTVLPDNTIDANFNLKTYLDGAEGILFFYPKDFTFVCPSEIIAFNNRLNEFTSRGVKVVGISTDSAETHLKWKNTEINDGGIGNVQYPLVGDESTEIAQAYDVLVPNKEVDGQKIAYRGTFLINKEGNIVHQVVNDLPLGRNIDEAIRMVDTLQFTDEHGEVCPAGWNKGAEGMKPDAEGVADYLAKNASNL